MPYLTIEDLDLGEMSQFLKLFVESEGKWNGNQPNRRKNRVRK